MKKIVLLLIVIVMIFMSGYSFAQDSGSKSLFHFGLKAAPALSWFTPGNKTITNDGSRLGFGYGLITEFGFTKNYAFSTGLEILNAGGKLGFPDSTLYTLPNATHSNQIDTFLLQKRTYRLRYVDLPLLLKFKTNQIGAMTYFGQFGLEASVLWKAVSDDDVSLIRIDTKSTNTDVDILKDANLIRLALNIGLGVEYNLSGSTSLVFSVNYNNGFTNALKKNSEYLYDKKFDTKFMQKAVFNYVGLTIGILF